MALTLFAIQNAKPKEKPYKLSDGEGLHLLVQPNGSKLWRFRYQFALKEKMLSLGTFPEVSLATARTKRDDARKLVAAGQDPSQQKKLDKIATKTAAENIFGVIAEEYLQKLKDEGKSEATLTKNRWLLTDLASPLSNRPLTEIKPAEILAILKRIEKSGRRDSAHRLRGVVGSLFRFAIANLKAENDPTYALRGSLLKTEVTHRPAITDEKQLGALMRSIDAYDGWPTLRAALLLLSLTMTRPGEVRQMRRSEIIFPRATWRIPAERMKMRQPHDVPLSRQALAVLRGIWDVSEGDLVLPSTVLGFCGRSLDGSSPLLTFPNGIEPQTVLFGAERVQPGILDLAGKMIFQTSDSSIAAKNILTDLENGQIITTAPNGQITPVNNVPASIGGLSALQSDWDQQAQNATTTYPAILGQTPPHGTAFRLQAGLVNEAAALFEYRRQEAGIFIQEIYNEWILPFLVKQLKDQKEVIGNLEPDELQMLSQAASEHEGLSFAKKQILGGKLAHNQDIAAIKQAAQNKVVSRGNRHSFNDFAGMFDNWEGNIDVDVTGEERDKQGLLATLFQLFGAVAQNPAMLQDPTLAKLFNQIVETVGVSPLLQTTPGAQGTPAQTTTPPSAPPTPPAPNAPAPLPANAIAR